jgi:molybdenum cofactor cytidylyltransferase
MFFGAVPVAEAAGAILAHGQKLGRQTFKKGRLLTDADCLALVAAGIAEVTVARLDAGDMPEDEAAREIAEAAAGTHVEAQAPFTGRANLFAAEGGLAVIDRARVDRLNLVDEAVTVATVPPYALVEARQMLATVKIIPFAAPRAAVADAAAIAAEGGPLIRVAPLQARRVALVMTRLQQTKESVLDKTAAVLSDRLVALGSTLAHQARCRHEAKAIATAIDEALAKGCDPVLVFGASAITDRRDEIPAGIERAGGEVVHFGMPVDPGNLLLLGRKGRVPVIGLPGCARSPKLNGFDWVLQRLLAGLEVRAQDIKLMGAGGLLMEIPSRPQPRAGEPAAEAAAAPRVVALVLAAGQSRRMGRRNKLLAEIDGVPMVRRVVEQAIASRAARTLLVSGHEPDRLRAVLQGLQVEFVHNPDYAGGLSTSLRAGIEALGPEVDGAVVLLGDMPRVAQRHIDRLIAAFNPLEGRAVCVPTYDGKRGNPVLFGRSLFAELKAVAGDVGARHLIGQHEDELAEVAMQDDAIFIDVDTPEALTAIAGCGA